MFGRVIRPVIVAACAVGLATSHGFSQAPCTSPSGGNQCGNGGQNTCTGSNGTICCKPVGPDVIVGDMPAVANYTASGGFDAMSFGTTSCNIGNQNLQWIAFSSGDTNNRNKHPVIGQALYRYRTVNGAGRMEQIGQSWLKHGFVALSENTCGCNGGGFSCSGSGGAVLGIGCADPYSAARNGSQGGLGPKWQVDASSGYYPISTPANPAWSGSTARRLRVATVDFIAGSRYFAETQYVAQDDAAYGNKNNNASHREVFVSGGPTDFSIAVSGSFAIQREKPGIMAWKAIDPAVTITNFVTPESVNPNATVYPPGGCCTSALVIVGAKATDLGGGIYRYEYAVQNLNSDRSIGSFSVPLGGGALDALSITNVGFHDVDYHSNDGEGSVTRDGTDWTPTITSTEIKWETVPFATNNNSNAIRWATTYNFRFDANTPPTGGKISLGQYKTPANILQGDSVIPTPVDQPAPCPADITNDTVINVNDLLEVINLWGPCVDCAADITGDDQVNVNDLLEIINNWGPCPSGATDGAKNVTKTATR